MYEYVCRPPTHGKLALWQPFCYAVTSTSNLFIDNRSKMPGVWEVINISGEERNPRRVAKGCSPHHTPFRPAVKQAALPCPASSTPCPAPPAEIKKTHGAQRAGLTAESKIKWIVPQFVFFQSNLIFWIVIRCVLVGGN